MHGKSIAAVDKGVKCVLLTGMSGTGKSTTSRELLARGYRSIDLDTAEWSVWADAFGNPTGTRVGQDWVWRVDRVQHLLGIETRRPLFLAGCAPNMREFLPSFDEIVLLTAPARVIEERLSARSPGTYGAAPQEVAATLANLEAVEPRLRRIATHEVDTRTPLDQVVAEIVRLATSSPERNA